MRGHQRKHAASSNPSVDQHLGLCYIHDKTIVIFPDFLREPHPHFRDRPQLVIALVAFELREFTLRRLKERRTSKLDAAIGKKAPHRYFNESNPGFQKVKLRELIDPPEFTDTDDRI